MVPLNPEELFEQALTLMEKGQYLKALEILKNLVENTDSSIYEIKPAYLSYYGYLTGTVHHDYKKAISMCNDAISKEFFHPDFYLNLGKLYLITGNKSMAIKTFYKGLKIDKTHEALLAQIKELGIRKKPLFTFLHRANLLNKITGRIRNLILKSRGRING